VYLEIYQQGVIVSNQARRIAEACNGDAPEDIVAGRDLWAGKGMTGKSTAETYSQEWSRLGFATRLRPAAVAPGSRVQSLRQVREYLKPYLAADGRTTTAGLQILRGHAPNLERTIQRLTFSETRPDDLADGCEDHAVDALRYGLMGRPTPRQLFQAVNPPSDFEARKLLAEVQHRRRTAGKRYIGSELRDARHLD